MIKPMEDIILYPDNSWCYRYEHWKYKKNTDDFVVVPYGSLFYPDSADFRRSCFDGITIHEVDYDVVVNAKLAELNKARNVSNNNH